MESAPQLIPGGTYLLGSDQHYPEEGPAHKVTVDEFRLDRYAVTNRQFAEFVATTGYRTVAERPLDPADFPGAPAENLVPGSLVFVGTAGPVNLRHINLWWRWTPGASWQNPEGPGSDVAGRTDHPVVHVAYEDAEAYCAWAGGFLPTEAQWEVAARGGLEGQPFTWGAVPESKGRPLANYWHGKFPWRADPGYGRTAPVGSFPPNGYGLHDMAGNVWEWTADWYGGHRSTGATDGDHCCAPANPRGGSESDSYDPAQLQFKVPRKVIKGGSFLCANNYCLRYRPAARRPQMVDTGMSHVGFRRATRPPGADS